MGTSPSAATDPRRDENATAAQRERIVVITSSYPAYAGDASGHFVQAEVNELRAEGHEVIVVAPRPVVEPTHRDVFIEPGVRWLEAGGAFGWPGVTARLRESPLRIGGVARFVYRAVRELDAIGDVDRVVAHFLLPSAFPVLAWSRLRAQRVEVVAHGSDARLFARLPAPVRRRVARLLRQRTTQLRCTSQELERLLEGALGSSFLGSVVVAASPVSISGTPARADARSLLGIAEDARLIVIVARLVAGKRVDVALRAAALVANARAVVVGDGPLRAELERCFPHVTFTGHVERSRALTYIAAADVVLSASLFEGSPTVVREARLLHTAVVALRAGDLPERYQDDRGVIVVSPSRRR